MSGQLHGEVAPIIGYSEVYAGTAARGGVGCEAESLAWNAIRSFLTAAVLDPPSLDRSQCNCEERRASRTPNSLQRQTVTVAAVVTAGLQPLVFFSA